MQKARMLWRYQVALKQTVTRILTTTGQGAKISGEQRSKVRFWAVLVSLLLSWPLQAQLLSGLIASTSDASQPAVFIDRSPSIDSTPSAHQPGWLIRITAQGYEQLTPEAEIVYRFRNGDRLVRLSAEHNRAALLDSEQVKYIEPDRPVESPSPLPSPMPREVTPPNESKSTYPSPSSARALANLAIDWTGFSQLSDSERQCDQSVIAVLDSGLATEHRQLSHVQLVAPLNLLDGGSSQVNDEFGHGTHVTGIIAASEALGAAGACLSATIMPIQFLGIGQGDISDAITGVQYAIDNNANIINHSWGTAGASQALFDVMQDADQRGIIQISAAGNSGSDIVRSAVFPAAWSSDFPNMLTVGNWDDTEQGLNLTSNYSWAMVDIAASGSDIVSLDSLGGVRTESGTSMAAPWLSAASAMVWQQQTEWQSEAVVSALLQSSIAEAGLTDSIRSGRRWQAQYLNVSSEPQAQVLAIERTGATITLTGFGLENASGWRFRSARSSSSAEVVALTPLDQQESQIIVANWDLPAGWFEWQNALGQWQQYAYQPAVAVPQNVQQQSDQNGHLITWQGADYISDYQILRTDQNSSGRLVATVNAPHNQYYDQTSDRSATYRIRARYTIEVGGQQRQLSSELSEYSLGVEQMVRIGTIPKQSAPMASAIKIAPFYPDSSARLQIMEDDAQLVSAIEADRIVIDNQQARQGRVEVTNARNGETRSLWLTVAEQAEWSVQYQGVEWLISPQSASIESVMVQDNTLHVSVIWQHDAGGSVLLHHSSSGKQISDWDSSISEVVPREQSIALTQTGPGKVEWALTMTLTSPATAASSDSRCFIATAVFPESPRVLRALRQFRDSVLLPMPGGQWLVDRYYQLSPWLIEWHQRWWG